LYIVPNVRETTNAPHGKLFREHFIASLVRDEKNMPLLRILVSSKEEAIMLWQMFFVELREFCEEDEACRKLSEAENACHIRVYESDPRLCLSSVYIFDPHDLNHDMAAYHAYWLEDDQVGLSIIPIPKPFLRPFSDLYYKLLVEEAEQSSSDIIIAIISFGKYVDQIIQGARPLLVNSSDA
jgi:hypothetical protein